MRGPPIYLLALNMALIRLDISDFRNLGLVKLEPLPSGFNLICGNNGSGKTSLLEAIYYLSLGRSFRSSVTSRIIRNTADKFSIFAQALQDNASVSLGLERQQNGELKIRMAGKDVNSIAELANLMPVQLINSNCHNLVDSGPIFRRKYLDWGVFYFNKDFLRVWRQFERVLKQRNAALRTTRSKQELHVWTRELVESAAQLDQLRQEYVQQLLPLIMSLTPKLFVVPDLELTYQLGWNNHTDYQSVLEASLDKDMQLGYTQFGPHRADLKITINHIPAKDILSRGQQKLLVCAMILAQGALLQSYTNKRPIYLIDDLPSELDTVSRSNLIALLSKQTAQVFVTAIERNTLDETLIEMPIKLFHVEHGCVGVM